MFFENTLFKDIKIKRQKRSIFIQKKIFHSTQIK